MLEPKKIYISGPITGTDDYAERFYAVHERLVEAGYRVANPAMVNASLPDDTTHEEYMRMSLTMMSLCDAVYMMKGYEKSEGCAIEFAEAVEKQMTIFFERNEEFGEIKTG